MTRQEALEYQESKVRRLTECLIREMEKSIKNLQCSLNDDKDCSYKLCSRSQEVARCLAQETDDLQKEIDKLNFLESVFKVVQ